MSTKPFVALHIRLRVYQTPQNLPVQGSLWCFSYIGLEKFNAGFGWLR